MTGWRAFDQRLDQAAQRLAQDLERLGLRIVLAESCTAGLASAALGRVPGISRFHCGSLVTYRETSKREWLAIDEQRIALHSAESAEVAADMAQSALARTPEADMSAAITGHLGPKAPPERDGHWFCAIALRHPPRQSGFQGVCQTSRRTERQAEAAIELLSAAAAMLEQVHHP